MGISEMSLPPATSDLVSELLDLRRGRGLFAEDVPQRAGWALRRQCGVLDGDLDSVVRSKLVSRLTETSSRLPFQVRAVVQAALAIPPEVRDENLSLRLKWAAGQIGRSERTALRRLKPGLCALAELLQAVDADQLPSSTTGVALQGFASEGHAILAEMVAAGERFGVIAQVAAHLASTVPDGIDQPVVRAPGPGEKYSITWPDDRYGLTPREEQVLGLIAQGLTNGEISYRLSITLRTVGTYVEKIFVKLGVNNRVQAAAIAHRKGFTPAVLRWLEKSSREVTGLTTVRASQQRAI